VVIHYADDLVALCHSQRQAGQVKARLAEWLAPRGLAFNEDKTRIVRLDEGFDFSRVQRPLLQRQAADQTQQSRHRPDEETAVVPVTRGWSLYYRCVVSKEVFTAMDNEIRLRRGLLSQPGGRLRRT
jgi:RNA-directed DNA polymerase